MNVSIIDSGLPGWSFCSSMASTARTTPGSFRSAAQTLLFSKRSYCSRARSVADALGAPDDGSGDGSRAVRAVREILAETGFPTMREAGVRAGLLGFLPRTPAFAITARTMRTKVRTPREAVNSVVAFVVGVGALVLGPVLAGRPAMTFLTPLGGKGL